LRNYCQQFWAKVDYDVDVNPPNPPVHETFYIMDGDDLSLAGEVNQFIASLTTDPRVINVQTTFKGSLYFLMDKTNLNLMLKPIGDSAMQLIDQFGTYPSYIYSGPNDNPRDGWTDDDGVERKAPPSDQSKSHGSSRKGGSLALVDALNEFLASLLSAGFKDTPGGLIDRLLKFIIHLNAGRQIDGAKLAILLQEIEDAVLNAHGS
jgi:hypothetical protein